jgi:hypothetical protein
LEGELKTLTEAKPTSEQDKQTIEAEKRANSKSAERS